MKQDDASFEDLLNETEVKDWLFRAQRDMFPKMKGSVLSLVIGSENGDAKLALEIGAAILFDKPLLVLIPEGRKIPDGLRRIAHTVIEFESFQSPETTERVRQAIQSIVAEVEVRRGGLA